MTIPFNFSFWAQYQPPIITTGLYTYFDGSNPSSLPTSATTGSLWTSISGTSTGTTATINLNDSGGQSFFTSNYQGGLYLTGRGCSINKLLIPSSGTTDWTYETWINTAVGGSGFDTLYVVGSGSILFRLVNQPNSEKIYVNPYTPSTYGEIGSGVTNGQNIHIVITYNYTTKETKCYVNNVLQSQVLSPVWTYNITSSSSSIGIAPGLAGAWVGTMYKIRTYAGVLTASQVENNWNAEKQQYGYY